MGFLSHYGALGQAAEVLCEAGHNLRDFFRARAVRNELVAPDLLTIGLLQADRDGEGHEPTISVVACRTWPDRVAVQADRGHGKVFPPGMARAPR